MTEWFAAFTIFVLCALALLLFIRRTQGMKGDINAARAEFRTTRSGMSVRSVRDLEGMR
jgi:hypothetical protein